MKSRDFLSRSVILLIILVVFALLSIGKVSNEPQSTITTPELRVPLSPSPTISTNPPKTLILCVHETKDVQDNWPVEEAMAIWNEGRSTGLEFGQDNCRAVILLSVDRIEMGAWGRTYGTHVTLSPDVPVRYRPHVLCHELGHVLGLGHTDHPDSCMNIDRLISHPSTEDLQNAGLNLWQY